MTGVSLTGAQVYPVLSSPEEGDERLRDRLLDLIEPTFARRVISGFLEAHTDELGRDSTGLEDAIEAWIGGPLEFESVWATPLIGVYAVMREGTGDATRAAAALGLHLATRGTECEWTATWRAPARLRWAHVLLPAATALAVDCRSGVARLDLTLPDGRHRQALLERSAAGSWSGEGLEAQPNAGAEALPRLLGADAVPPGCSLSDDIRAALVPQVRRDAVSAFSRALAALDEHAPLYSNWVRRVILDVLVLQVDGTGMRSGSNTSWPGLVYMSAEEPLVLADNLVHEASHQYFHLLARIEAVDDGSDTAAYFSPVTGRERPLSAILVAYHAFANVAMLLRTWMAGGLDDRGYCRARLADVMPKLRELERPIRDNPALTEIGRALSEPLIRRVGTLG